MLFDSISFTYRFPSESISIPSGCSIWIAEVPSCGIFLTKVKLDKDIEDAALEILFDDSRSRLGTSITKSMKMKFDNRSMSCLPSL